MMSNYEYMQESVTDSRQRIVLQLRAFSEAWQPLTIKETSNMLRNATKSLRRGQSVWYENGKPVENI
jgi:hypothetical protein